jgi:hypothetical protein
VRERSLVVTLLSQRTNEEFFKERPPPRESDPLWIDAKNHAMQRFQGVLKEIAAILSKRFFAEGGKIRTRFNGGNRCAEVFMQSGEGETIPAQLELVFIHGREFQMTVRSSLGREAEVVFSDELPIECSFETFDEKAA